MAFCPPARHRVFRYYGPDKGGAGKMAANRPGHTASPPAPGGQQREGVCLCEV